jgi:hypothetical protein
MNPELVKFHLPTTDQFSVAVDNSRICVEKTAKAATARRPVRLSMRARLSCLRADAAACTASDMSPQA